MKQIESASLSRLPARKWATGLKQGAAVQVTTKWGGYGLESPQQRQRHAFSRQSSRRKIRICNRITIRLRSNRNSPDSTARGGAIQLHRATLRRRLRLQR